MYCELHCLRDECTTRVQQLLVEAGVELRQTVRSYRPLLSIPDCEVKLLKPQNIVEMLCRGSRDLGFAGGRLGCRTWA